MNLDNGEFFFKKKKKFLNCFWKMERFFSKKINLIYFGKWRDLGSLTYNSPLQEKKKEEEEKKTQCMN